MGLKKILLVIALTLGLGVAAPLGLIFLFYSDLFTEPRMSELPGIFAIAIGFPSLSTYLIRSIARHDAKKQWDPLFVSFGFQSGGYLTGRQYHGTWDGGIWDIYIHATRRTPVPSMIQIPVYNGHIVELFLEAPCKTVWAASKWAGKEQIVRSKDEVWTHNFLKKSSVQKTVEALLQQSPLDALSSVHGGPNTVYFTIRTDQSEITEERVKQWMRNLQELAKYINKEVTPSQVVTESIFWKWTRKNRTAFHWIISLGCFGILALPFLILSYFLFLKP